MDGWNTEEMGDVMYTLDMFSQLQYELNSCIKGAYTGCHTYQGLEDYIVSLCKRLMSDVDGISYLDDHEDTEDEI